MFKLKQVFLPAQSQITVTALTALPCRRQSRMMGPQRSPTDRPTHRHRPPRPGSRPPELNYLGEWVRSRRPNISGDSIAHFTNLNSHLVVWLHRALDNLFSLRIDSLLSFKSSLGKANVERRIGALAVGRKLAVFRATLTRSAVAVSLASWCHATHAAHVFKALLVSRNYSDSKSDMQRRQ